MGMKPVAAFYVQRVNYFSNNHAVCSFFNGNVEYFYGSHKPPRWHLVFIEACSCISTREPQIKNDLSLHEVSIWTIVHKSTLRKFSHKQSRVHFNLYRYVEMKLWSNVLTRIYVCEKCTTDIIN